MIKKYCGYYKSPIGIAEIICSEDSVLSVTLVVEEKLPEESNLMVRETIKQLDEYFNGTRKEFKLKLSPEGTDFQKQVWNELLQIPYGKTCSYKDIAVNINNKKSVRAVGGANGKNKIWIIIPCHRVIGANGTLTGYAGGVDKKQWLLEHEKNIK